jgi:hypothetical protein
MRILTAFLLALTLLASGLAATAPAMASGAAKESKDGKDKDGKEDKDKGTFLKLEPMAAPLPMAEGKKTRRQMMLTLQLEVAPSNAEKVNGLMPRIRDAFIREMFARPVGTPDGWDPGDLETVKTRLVQQATKVAGDGVIRDVLVVQAVRIGGF